MPSQTFEVLSAPAFADEANRQLSNMSDLEAVRAVARFLGCYTRPNSWGNRNSHDFLSGLDRLDDYDQLRTDLNKLDRDIPFFAWSCRLLKDSLTSPALSLLAYGRSQPSLQSFERAFCESASTSVAGLILGEVSPETSSQLVSISEVIKSHTTPLQLSMEQRQYLAQLATTPASTDTDLRTELESLAQLQVGWVDEDALHNPDIVLAGEPAPFLELVLSLIKDRDDETFDLAMRLTSFVAHTTNCAPAGWLMRCLNANCEADAMSVDTTDAANYVLPEGFYAEDTENNTASPLLSQGQVLLAPNYPPVSGTRNTERLTALKSHKTLSEPIDLWPLSCDVDDLHTRLMAEFPWFERVTDRICHDLELRQAYGQPAVQISPLLLWGTPGSGKTRYATRVAEHLNLPSATLSFAGAADDRMLRGTGAGWGTAQPAFPVTQMALNQCPNPLLIVDEIEKAAANGKNGGDPWATMLMFLEPQNARRFFDECLMATVDLSHINWLATANETKRMPMPLLSRFRVIETPVPEAQHLPAILLGVRRDMAAKLQIDPRFIPELDEAEVLFLTKAFQNTGNVRTVIRLTEDLLRRRERQLRDMPQ